MQTCYDVLLKVEKKLNEFVVQDMTSDKVVAVLKKNILLILLKFLCKKSFFLTINL